MFSSRLTFIVILLPTLFFALPKAFASEAAPPIFADQALVMDLSTDTTLYEKNAEQPVPIASLTKLMVALLALETLDLQKTVTLSQEAATTPGSTAHLEAGEQFTVESLLFALLVPSGNDAAVALAETLAQNQTQAVASMNLRAGALGLVNTHYANVTGFDGGGGQASAADLSTLAQTLLTYDLFRKIIQTPTFNLFSLEGLNHPLTTTNQLLGETVSGLTVVGMKTGTTPEAGQCLMVLAQDEKGAEVLITLLGSTDRYADAKALLTWVGQNFPLEGPPPAPEPPPSVSLADWPFPDLSTYEPYFFDSLVALKNQGVVTGDDETGLLRGDEPLNRAEMVTFLLRAAGYDTAEKIRICATSSGDLTTSFFLDVPLKAWYSLSVHCAAQLGWVSGDDLSPEAALGTLPTFRPGEPVNLPEALKLILKSQSNLPTSVLEDGNWYDAYLKPFLARSLIKKEETTASYLLSYTSYDLGSITDSISRAAAFELLYRLMQTNFQEDENSPYQPDFGVEDYQAQGATVELREGKLFVSDPHLGFEISNLPMGQFELSDLRFYIQNPSGFTSDYHTDWSILYPLTQEGVETSPREALFQLSLYDPDYLAAGLAPSDLEEGSSNQLPFKFTCANTLDHADLKLTSLYLYLCPGGEKSEGVEVSSSRS